MINNIISSFSDLTEFCYSQRLLQKKIVWTNGCFDILHPGHIATLRRAKEYGDILIVGMNGDHSPYWKTKPGRPITSQTSRSTLLAAIRYVDGVYIVQQETPMDIIEHIKPDILVKSGNMKPQDSIGYEYIKKYGGDVIVLSPEEGFSTTHIINSIKYSIDKL